VAMSSSQLRRDQAQPTYASAPTSATTTTTTMYAPIAERAIPYEQYMSRDGDHIYSASRVTPRNAPTASRVATDDAAAAQELRQFSREPTVISLSSTVDGDVKTTTPATGSRLSSAGGDRARPVGSGGDGACITAGFDSNTLKRMLQTLPELSTPVDLMQEFEEEFADVVGPPSGSSAARDDVKPPPPPPLEMPPPPTTNDDHPVSTGSSVTAASTASERPVDATPPASHADVDTSSAKVIAPTASDVSKAKAEGDGDCAELDNGDEASAAVQLSDVALTTITSSGKCHAVHFASLLTNGRVVLTVRHRTNTALDLHFTKPGLQNQACSGS